MYRVHCYQSRSKILWQFRDVGQGSQLMGPSKILGSQQTCGPGRLLSKLAQTPQTNRSNEVRRYKAWNRTAEACGMVCGSSGGRDVLSTLYILHIYAVATGFVTIASHELQMRVCVLRHSGLRIPNPHANSRFWAFAPQNQGPSSEPPGGSSCAEARGLGVQSLILRVHDPY